MPGHGWRLRGSFRWACARSPGPHRCPAWLRRAAGHSADGAQIVDDMCFVDAGVSGATLIRPQLERLRDCAKLGAIDQLYILSPDWLARKYAHQALRGASTQDTARTCCSSALRADFLNRTVRSLAHALAWINPSAVAEIAVMRPEIGVKTRRKVDAHSKAPDFSRKVRARVLSGRSLLL
ncbi:hypothetical protein CNECB9_350060 [Cupriavidus necator]|uniref:Resolvase/invertase-type recombinase catalytic domain-containing protein n=1 Tax=Cupriavidus necator TaxID=106590 RepID=A0A1K0JCX8_CUPNE|nr:hypothetical protein CNECB9_350060 [Cupriavidus necator]